MDKDEDMSAEQASKPKSDSYAYSWFLQAPGNNGSVIAPQAPPAETTPAEAPESELQAQEARTEEWRHSGNSQQGVARAGIRLDQAVIRLVGVAGWSAVAGAGAILLANKAGGAPPIQMGILGGVWVGVSLAIWFIPGLLSRMSS